MTILSEGEIKKYKGLMVSELEKSSTPRLGRNSIERLKLAERELFGKGFEDGLLYYVTFQYHIKGRGIQSLAKEAGVDYSVLIKMLENYKIPRLSNSEARRRQFEDPEFLRKMAEARIRRMEKLNNRIRRDPTAQERVTKAFDKIATYNDTKIWRNVIPEVSEITGIDTKIVELYLEELFKT